MSAARESFESRLARIEEKQDSLLELFWKMIKGDVECHVGQSLRSMQSNAWKAAFLSVCAPIVVSVIVGVLFHFARLK